MSDAQENIDLLRQSGRFDTEEEFLEEALRALLEKRPELRVELAVEQFKTGDVTLNRAAEVAGCSPEMFKEILQDRGIDREIGFLDDDERERRLDTL